MGHVLPLWLPILVSAILVFVASSVLWMALPFHKNDFQRLPNEETIAGSIRAQGLRPGIYSFPWCDRGGTSSEAEKTAQANRFKQGPWGFLVISGPFSFGRTLSLWFVYLLVVGLFVGYLTNVALDAGTPTLRVFRVAGTAAFLVHAGGLPARCIWEGKPWSHLPVALLDAVVYTLLTAAAFAWLWPNSEVAAA